MTKKLFLFLTLLFACPLQADLTDEELKQAEAFVNTALGNTNEEMKADILKSLKNKSIYLNRVIRGVDFSDVDGLFRRICDLKFLESIYFFRLGLTKIPPEIGQLVNLKEMNLASTCVEEIPVEIGQLAALKDLNLNACPIKRCSNQVLSLTKLTSFQFMTHAMPVADEGEFIGLEGLKAHFGDILHARDFSNDEADEEIAQPDLSEAQLAAKARCDALMAKHRQPTVMPDGSELPPLCDDWW